MQRRQISEETQQDVFEKKCRILKRVTSPTLKLYTPCHTVISKQNIDDKL